jgi:hypothetical protein
MRNEVHASACRRWPLRRPISLALLLSAAALAGCYERRDAVVLNPDGSGKVSIQVDIAVAAGEHQKPDPVGTGKLFAADLINHTSGVDAWADVAISAAADGRAHIVATAYFSDINKLKLSPEIPIEFVWKRDADGALFAVQRIHSSVKSAAGDQVKALVKQSQEQYRQNEPVMHVQLGAYSQTITLLLPGELADEKVLERRGNTVTLALDGKKVAKAVDDVMSNDDALAATFSAGADGAANDDILMQSMFGKKGPISVHSKFATGAAPLFDYKAEMRAAQRHESDMLDAAGVQLVPKFTVKGLNTTSAPATTTKPK